jgi:hypothetical protein
VPPALFAGIGGVARRSPASAVGRMGAEKERVVGEKRMWTHHLDMKRQFKESFGLPPPFMKFSIF